MSSRTAPIVSLEHLVLDLVLEHVERAQQGHARADHRRQLARHDRELGGLDPLEGESSIFSPDFFSEISMTFRPLALQLRGDRVLGRAAELALGRDADAVDGLV